MKRNIRPAQPIDVPELLQGRSQILKDIGRTLHSPGMHVFIHGERSIGKTSIALTAAKSFFRADPPWVGCDENSTFEGIVRDVCGALLDKKYLNKSREVTGSAGINVGLFKVEGKVGTAGELVIPEKLTSVNHAANLIKESALHSHNLLLLSEMQAFIQERVPFDRAHLIKNPRLFRRLSRL